MDSNPDFLSSMKYVKEVLAPRFQEERRKEREQAILDYLIASEALQAPANAIPENGESKVEPKEKKKKHPFVKDYGTLIKEGVRVQVTNLTAFLRDQGYPRKDTAVLHRVLRGQTYFYRGWTLVGGPVEGMTRSEIMTYILKQQEVK